MTNDNSRSAQNLRALIRSGYYDKVWSVFQKQFNYGDLLFLTMGPIILGWSGIYFFLLLAKWVIRGFSNSAGKQNQEREKIKLQSEDKKETLRQHNE